MMKYGHLSKHETILKYQQSAAATFIKHRDFYTKTLHQISQCLGHASLHCEIRYLPDGPTWLKRCLLRKQLVEQLKKQHVSQSLQQQDSFLTGKEWCEGKSQEWEHLCVPGHPPIHPLFAISISHCPVVGGYVFSSEKNKALGFDVELVDRVRPSLIGRISDAWERTQVSDPALLWVMKEAVIKCVRSQNKKAFFKNIRISRWKTQGHFYLFCFEIPEYGVKGMGGTFRADSLAFAYAQLSVQ